MQNYQILNMQTWTTNFAESGLAWDKPTRTMSGTASILGVVLYNYFDNQNMPGSKAGVYDRQSTTPVKVVVSSNGPPLSGPTFPDIVVSVGKTEYKPFDRDSVFGASPYGKK